MYGTQRMNYRQRMSSMQGNTPAETPLGSVDTPMEEPDGGGYFDFGDAVMSQQWQPPQQQPPPLDPVEEMERDLMGYDPQFEVVPQIHLNPQMNPQMGVNPQLNPQLSQRLNQQIGSRLSPQIQGPMNQQVHGHMQGPMQGPVQAPMQHPIQGPMQGPIPAGALQNSIHQGGSLPNNSLHGGQLQGSMQGSNTPMQDPSSLPGVRQNSIHNSMPTGHLPRSPQMNAHSLTHSPQLVGLQHPPKSTSHTPSVPMIVDGPKPLQVLKLEELRKSRKRYKPRSSIPPDLSSANYAAQCIAAAESSRLSPYHLSLGEYSHLRNRLPHIHVTTYLNIRNGILRLWLANPLVAVTVVEAAGCCKETRYYLLAEFAFEWLVRNGYINQGCCTHQGRYSSSIAGLPKFSNNRRKPRQTIAIIGAGVAGLSCARQLENLLERYSTQILSDYEDLPRVVVLEGRKRIGGRVYSPQLSTKRMAVDLGGDTIMGFGGGNPLGVVLRRQLGIPVVSIDTTGDENVLYDGETGEPISAQVDYRAHEMFKYLLDRMRNFEMGLGTMNQPPTNAPGVKSLIRAGQDPQIMNPDDEKVTIGQFEEDMERPYTQSGTSDEAEVGQEIKVELDFLESIGFTTKPKSAEDKGVRVHAEPASHGTSLGITMKKLIDHLSSLTDLQDEDKEALDWYMAKFEYLIGDNLENACLSSWSHHRSNRFTGRHSWTRDGMSTFVKGLDTVPNKLDVRFKTVVNVVEYEEDSAQLTLENGEQVVADRVIVTVPLGCLKRRNIQFIPDMPQWKLDSIDRLEFGVVNKVVLVFDQPFWDANTPSIIRIASGTSKDTRGQCFVFQNHSRRSENDGKALIVGLVSGTAAKKLTETPDFEIIEPAVAKLRKVFKNNSKAQSAKLVESIVTRWQIDRFSRGSFSHVGVDGTVTDHDLLARPVLRSLFFAGEATSRTYPGSIHGAYISGLRAAKEVLNSLVGGIEVPDQLLVDENEWNFDDTSVASGDLRDSSSELTDMKGNGGNNGNGSNSTNLGSLLSQHQRHEQHLQRRPGASPVGGMSVNGMYLDPSRQSTNGVSSVSLNPPSESQEGAGSNPSVMESTKGHAPSPETMASFEPVDYSKAESELLDLRKRRKLLEKEQLERDMMHEIGPRPEKPERHGTTNPFLLFQKDYWDICRQETEAAKRKDKKNGQVHASRNEIRACLGKKWRSLPDAERAPYIERSQQSKVENEERQESFLRKLKWYESEAANFRQQWVQEHPSIVSLRERQLEDQLEGYRPRKKRSRLTE